MDIDTSKSSGEEEYRPSDYDPARAFEAPPVSGADGSGAAGTGGIFERLKRKNILIAIGIIVAVFVIYKIADVLFTPGHKTRQKLVGHPQLLTSPQPIKPSSVAANQTAVQPVGANSMSGNTTAVVNRLSGLEQQVVVTQTNLERLNTQVNDMQTALTSIDSKLTSLTESVQTVAGVVAAQQEEKQAAKRKAAMALREAPRPIYYIKAMVPGRAWLVSQGGSILTISLGANLPGYGIVEVIDPNQGTLVTNTGAIIGYSPSDS